MTNYTCRHPLFFHLFFLFQNHNSNSDLAYNSNVKAAFHQGLCFPIGPIWTRLSPMIQFFDRPDCRPESPPIVPFFDPIESRPMDHGGGHESRTFLARSTRFRGASMRKYARDKGTFRGPSDDQDDHGPTVFDRLLFFNMFKNSSRSLFRYPTLGGLRRSRQIFPRRYRVVRDSARRFPTIFAKMRPIDQKKDRVLSGPKQSLVKWPL